MRIRRDKKGILRSLVHSEQPYFSKDKFPPTPQLLANEYLHEVAQLYQIEELIKELDRPLKREIKDEGIRLSFKNKKVSGETHILFYQQSCFGIPIWGSGLTIFLQDFPLRVIRSQNKLHYEIEKITTPKKDGKFLPNSEFLYSHLRTLAEEAKTDLLKIDSQKLWIYKYDAKERKEEEPEKGMPLTSNPIIFPLPPVPDTIHDGEYYTVTGVEFLLKMPYGMELKWNASIHIEDGTILYIRAMIALFGALVFEIDPISATGDPSFVPESDTEEKKDRLNNRRVPVDLENLIPTTPQQLTGEFAELIDQRAPYATLPTLSEDENENAYDVWTNDFAAVNGYYHVNTFIKYIEGLGLDISKYFGSFPILIEHFGYDSSGQRITTGSYGASGGGTRLTFNLANSNDTIGIAVDVKVVIHELAHLIIHNQRGDSVNLDFAHSHGDILGILFTDPKSAEAYQLDNDLRYRTAPFVYQFTPRRHDRNVSDGYGWGGTLDDMIWRHSEQILSTTLFRLYLSMGGDDSNKERQKFASDYITFLLFRATGCLGPRSNGALVVEDFVDDLIGQDTYPFPLLNQLLMTGNLGVAQIAVGRSLTDGCAKKVIRWSFEKQGLYGGNPPEVDIYIDDGRNGEYEYDGYPNSQDIWNRYSPDGKLFRWNENPKVGVKNYVYVKINNRGTQKSSKVYVKGWMSPLGIGLTWPDDFKPLLTEELTFDAGILPNQEVIVGPFEWIPEDSSDIVLISVSCLKDPSIIDRKRYLPLPPPLIYPRMELFAPTWSLWRLTLLDNNIAMWGHSFFDLVHVSELESLIDIIRRAQRMEMIIRNPFVYTAHIEVIPEFHHQFSSAGWDLKFMNLGMNAFTLGPKANKKLEFEIKSGDSFSGKLNEELESFLKIKHQKDLIKSGVAEKKREENKKKLDKLGFRILEDRIFLDFLRLRVNINNFPIGHMDYSIRFSFKEK